MSCAASCVISCTSALISCFISATSCGSDAAVASLAGTESREGDPAATDGRLCELGVETTAIGFLARYSSEQQPRRLGRCFYLRPRQGPRYAYNPHDPQRLPTARART